MPRFVEVSNACLAALFSHGSTIDGPFRGQWKHLDEDDVESSLVGLLCFCFLA